MRPPHSLVTFSGDISSETQVYEQWSFSLRCATDGLMTIAQAVTNAAAARTAWINGIGVILPSQVRLNKVLVADVGAFDIWRQDAGGGYIKGESTSVTRATGAVGPQLPLQSALAISLVTARAGSTGKGRFFLPLTQETLAADGRLNTARIGPIRSNAKAFINEINAIATLGNVVVSSSKGYESFVTGVRVGYVVDTLRSRRRSQLEAYSFEALV